MLLGVGGDVVVMLLRCQAPAGLSPPPACKGPAAVLSTVAQSLHGAGVVVLVLAVYFVYTKHVRRQEQAQRAKEAAAAGL
jgi:hypothetical protein